MKLTPAQLKYLLWTIEFTNRSGHYYGNRLHFINRSKEVKKIINQELAPHLQNVNKSI